MWVVPVFSVSLFPSSSVFWLNYDCNEPLNYNNGPKEQEMIFKDRINFLLIFGCNSPVCLSVCLSVCCHVGPAGGAGGVKSQQKTYHCCLFLPFRQAFCFLFKKSGGTILEPSESTNWGADETYRHISAAAPAFLLSLHGIRFLPAKPFALSFQPLVKQVLWRQTQRELPLSSFPDIGDSTAESDGGDSGESSLTRCCCFHLSPPVPQFPLTSPSTNTTTLSDQFPGSTWFRWRVPQALGRSAPQGWKKTINITKLSWSITLYHCIPLQKVEFFIQRVNDARMLVALGDWWNLYLFAACQSPGWSMSLMFNS